MMEILIGPEAGEFQPMITSVPNRLISQTDEIEIAFPIVDDVGLIRLPRVFLQLLLVSSPGSSESVSTYVK